MYFVVFEPFNFMNTKKIKQNLHEKLMINYLPLIRFLPQNTQFLGP